MSPYKIALVQGGRTITYADFYKKSSQLASNLANRYKLKAGDHVALMAGNSIESVFCLFALARSGVHIYMLNPEMSELQFARLYTQHPFNFIVYEQEQSHKIPPSLARTSLPLTGHGQVSVQQLMHQSADQRIGKRAAGNIIVLTAGTTGSSKTASRQQSISNFINPLTALIEEVKLHTFKSVYIPTPIYHGYGLAALMVAVLLGKTIYFTKGFSAKEACKIIAQHQIELVTLVPVMLQRILNENPSALKSLKAILSGGATLNSRLISKTSQSLQARLYNLYGTSEVGFCILASPKDLALEPESIGKPIKGVDIRIHPKGDIGMLEVRCQWSVKARTNRWLATGDLAFIDQQSKLVYLKGRSDSMIVSGGENVYPKELEDVLYLHEQIDMAAVIGVDDDEFGQRLKAFVSVKANARTNEQNLRAWLKSRVAPYQMPVCIVFLEKLPLNSIGKVDKKLLV